MTHVLFFLLLRCQLDSLVVSKSCCHSGLQIELMVNQTCLSRDSCIFTLRHLVCHCKLFIMKSDLVSIETHSLTELATDKFLYLKLELNSLAIGFTTLDHRFELFNCVSTQKSQSRYQETGKDSPLPDPPKLPQEIAEDQPCPSEYFLPKP